MLSEKICNMLNDQISFEWYSAYLYAQLGAWFKSKDLDGFAHWMEVQAQEELGHGKILFEFVGERNGTVKLGPLEEPPHSFDSPLEVMRLVLKHEQDVSSAINDLYNAAEDENDLPTKNRLEWFIQEQVEEEATPQQIIARLELTGGDGSGLFLIDRELAKRQYKEPQPLAESA